MKHLPDLLTLRHKRPLFCMSVPSSVRLSTFMSTFDIYVKVSILINCKTKQPSNLAWNISLTSRLCDVGAHFSIRLSVRPSVCLLTVLLCRSLTFMSKLVFLSTTILQQPWYLAWHISLTSSLGSMLTQWPWPIFFAPLALTQFTLTFQIFSTIRCTTTKPCIVLLLDVLTWQVPWPGDLDLYFALQWLWHILCRRSISPQL